MELFEVGSCKCRNEKTTLRTAHLSGDICLFCSCALFNVHLRQRCCVYFKWVIVSINTSDIPWGFDIWQRKAVALSQRFVDSNRSTRSHFPEEWNLHHQSLWRPRISDVQNVCRTAATLTAYCAVSPLNWTLNQDGACFWNSSRCTQYAMEASGQLHPLATLTARKVAPISIRSKHGGPQNQSYVE